MSSSNAEDDEEMFVVLDENNILYGPISGHLFCLTICHIKKRNNLHAEQIQC